MAAARALRLSRRVAAAKATGREKAVSDMLAAVTARGGTSLVVGAFAMDVCDQNIQFFRDDLGEPSVGILPHILPGEVHVTGATRSYLDPGSAGSFIREDDGRC